MLNYGMYREEGVVLRISLSSMQIGEIDAHDMPREEAQGRIVTITTPCDGT